MQIWLDGEEITPGIGEYFHTHFRTDYYDSDDPGENESEAEVVRRAIGFIQAVLADKVVIYTYSRMAGSYYRGSTDMPSMKPGMKEYVWSGPFVRVA